MIETKVCNCGGEYIYRDGKWKCGSCGRPMPQILDSRENQLLAFAEGTFAQDKFLEAEELYGEIVKSYPECYAAYWGLALVRHGIKLVDDDLRTGEKVVTCWAPEVSSIKDDKNYKKVLAYAPSAERPYYEKKADEIEKILQQWQEEARKLKPYDVFICYKETEEHTKVRTQDSFDLADLYNRLTMDKYNVFFSMYSLDGIAAEHYEPYIFQALSTAKVMIVYGSKEEYFESTWMKNEWTRFSHKIAEGRKAKNSLLPVIKDCDPGALPPRLRTLQALDAGKNTFYSDLTRYIDKVLSAGENAAELKRNAVKFGERREVNRQQSRKIESRTLQAANDIENVSAQGEQLMRVINSFVQQGQFQRAEKFCDTWIKSNPTNYRDLEELVKTILKAGNYKLANKYIDYIVDMAPDRKRTRLWQLMTEDGYTQIDEWAKNVIPSRHISLDYMQKVLPLISENEVSVLYAYYDGLVIQSKFGEKLKNMISYVLEYNADANKKNEFINSILKVAILDPTNNYSYFDFVLSLLSDISYRRALTSFVDTHIEKNNISALVKILPLLEGVVYFRAHTALIEMYFKSDDYAMGVAETEKLLGYIEDENSYSAKLNEIINMALGNLGPAVIQVADDHVFRLLSFTKENNTIEDRYFARIAQLCCEAKYRKGVERYAKLLLGCGDQGKYLGYYYLMLLDLNCFTDEDVASLKYEIADTNSYNIWLANSAGKYLDMVTKYLQDIDDLREKVRQEKAAQKLNKKQKRAKRVERAKDIMSDGAEAIGDALSAAWPVIKIAIIVVIALLPVALSIIANVMFFRDGDGTSAIVGSLVPTLLITIPSYIGLIRQDNTFKVVLAWIAVGVILFWNIFMTLAAAGV